MEQGKIYTLTSPITNQVYYVGYTNNPLQERFRNHLSWNKPTTVYLKSIGLVPIMEVLETCDYDASKTIEEYWIHQFKAWGFALENGFISKNPSAIPVTSHLTVSLSKKERLILKKMLSVRGSCKTIANKSSLHPTTIRNICDYGKGDILTINKLRATVLLN